MVDNSIIQRIEIEALEEFDSFACMYNIDYFLRGGSVLGAVKYRGMVPEDDDIDIALIRKDYDLLIDLIKSGAFKSDKFLLLSYHNCDKLHCYFPRILLNEEFCLEFGIKKNNPLGATIIDILPIDGTPNNALVREFYFILIYFLRVIAAVFTYQDSEVTNRHTLVHNFLLLVLSKLGITNHLSQKQIYNLLDKLYKANNCCSSNYIGTITGSKYRKEIMKKDIWGNGIKLQFEGSFYLVPEKYDEYLKHLYQKNYMTYTPTWKEKKMKRHIDLDGHMI